MKRKLAALLVAAAVAGAVLVPVHLLADIASCSVNASSYADAVLNPSRGEDTEFFVTTGGVPNIMFVLDTSGSMVRLPPDGASMGWGSFGNGYGCTNTWANTRTYASPCGSTTLDGSPYNPTPGFAPPDFAQAKDASGRYCPYLVTGNQPPATNLPGFDPDFYGGAAGNPWFFERDKVYHDATLSGSDGWTDWTTSPANYLTYGDFCNQWSATPAMATSCATCMRDQGYFFDGSYPGGAGSACGTTADCSARNSGTCIQDGTTTEYSGVNNGTAHCMVPNVWFTGNFLSFNPPKFLVARKVLKDVLQSVRKIRLGLTIFSPFGQGGVLLQGLNPPCNLVGSPSSFDSNRGAILNAINSKNKVRFAGLTPLAETLLDVGNLYLSNNVTPAPTWFNTTFQDTGFQEKASNNRSVCFSCQASAALVITDGLSTDDGNVPGPGFAASPMTLAVANTAGSVAGMAGYNVTDITSADCPTCNTAAEAADTTIPPGGCYGQQASGACDDSGNPIPSYLPKVAWYLKNMDFRPDAEIGTDGLPMTKKQSITTYTIGLGTRGNAAAILNDAAQAGGGLYNGGTGADVNDARTLRDAIMKVLEDVNTRSTSFGSASLSTLQIASTQGVLIPRFSPSRAANWNGHLYSFDLYSEFSSGCRPVVPASASGPANGDYDCDGKCGSVFLKDADGDFIQEDANGAFKKNLVRTLAPCAGSKCSAASCSQPDPNAPARPYWDAGSKLAPVSTQIDPVSGATIDSANPDFRIEWSARNIYTAIDRNGDGKIDSADVAVAGDGALVPLTAANAATLVPYLNIKGTRYCQKLATLLTSHGNPMGGTINTQVASGNYAGCAEILIDYVRGADVFNERGCSGFPTTYCSRKYQLGDIFHSSPIEVLPPFTSQSWYCSHGAHAQCLASLFSGAIPNPSTATPANANAYDDYAKSTRYRTRKKFALVGGNDGMLHAFRIERTDPQAGEELWAFIPPDLLPKLRMLTEGVHQFYVDATPMVRDVWMDGVPNMLPSGTAAANGVREGGEFHTVAVVGERRGGTHYFALDVTDASSDLAAKPSFLWMYPQPNNPESLSFGETYSEFLPKPPPIGPVKIDAGAPPCPAGTTLDPDGSNRCFKERWIAFLSGGFDPQYTKGRGVHMVALDTGDELWDFSQPPGSASLCGATSDPRCHLNYPVAATVGMVMWGSQPASLSAGARSYFDTATFGDTGGQLWTLRFATPGQLDPTTKKVTNWFGARAFQHGLNASTPACGLGYCDSQPFFHITSNLALAANGLYRTLNGTGDRFNVLDPIGGTCGPDNLRACLLKGCTVTLTDAAGGPGATYGVEPLLGKQTYSATHPAYCTSVDPTKFVYGATAPSGAACTTVTSSVNGVTITCPSTNTCSGATETTQKNASATCTSDACDSAAANTFGIPIDMKGNPDKLNWFFSVLVFERNGTRSVFSDLAGAQAYDAARLKEGDLQNVNAADTNPAPSNLASPEGKGWSYFFDHGKPSTLTPWTVPMAGVDNLVYRTDERVASVSDVQYGCAFWNTLQTGIPVGAVNATTECPVASPCKAGHAQVSYLYGANAGTGANCLKVDGTYVRSQKSEVISPPQMGKLVLFVGDNQVLPGLTKSDPGRGASSVPLADPQDIAASTEWLPIDRSAHACRHAGKESQAGFVQPTDAACRQE